MDKNDANAPNALLIRTRLAVMRAELMHHVLANAAFLELLIVGLISAVTRMHNIRIITNCEHYEIERYRLSRFAVSSLFSFAPGFFDEGPPRLELCAFVLYGSIVTILPSFLVPEKC